MIDDYSTIIFFITCGFGSGIFVSLSSGTAIAIMIPCLTILLNNPIENAIGTSLIVDCVIGAVAGFIYLKNKNVDLRSGFLLTIVAIIGALIGSRFTGEAPGSGLGFFIGIFLIITGLVFIARVLGEILIISKIKLVLKFLDNTRYLS